ncbi:MAG: hypothetical protein F4Z00_11140 [Acidimicrobiaceae bacterium]|nr:hypothetical protein [Acidimicrobiaceae bacterium]MXZ66083.1 hypothetical protein [Acidimicrobiaceae bacterium]MYF33026.1 hypothetical protein [Acidimicrobiaceae bacterium]MYG79681.1 hypothetical protein [Acidimicrobiaceae bacterium]MYJ28677.1 hypothetical protein [Acidimicrobiaceae bacterium]
MDWTMNQYTSPGRTRTHEARLGRLERTIDRSVLPGDTRSALVFLRQALDSDDGLLLDAADVALTWASEDKAALLEAFSVEARSTYGVGVDEDDVYMIQRRQPEELSSLIETEATQPGRQAEHLRIAWAKCFGLHPDLNEACTEVVKAIEVAAKPVVTPDDPLATLGKMISAVRDKPEEWETDSEFDGSVQTVLAMMDMVWNGQLRHGDEDAPLEVSQEAAEMTVQTAVLLVSWFRSGRVRLRS